MARLICKLFCILDIFCLDDLGTKCAGIHEYYSILYFSPGHTMLYITNVVEILSQIRDLLPLQM